MDLIFILADSSIEPIPKELLGDPVISREALKRRKDPRYIVLDSTKHHRAMKKAKIANVEKRGRPDIVHRALLTILDSLLVKKISTKIYVHTICGQIIEVLPHTRLPRNYIRFIGLIETLFEYGGVPQGSAKPLIKLLDLGIRNLLEDIRKSGGVIIGFSRRGKRIKDLSNFLKEIISKNDLIAFVVGAFPKGFFSDIYLKYFNHLISLSEESLSTSYVLCKIISTCEQLLI